MSSYFGGIITSTNPINTIYYVGNTISGILDTNNTITITPPYISETSTRYDFSPINAMVIGGGGGGGGHSSNNIANAGSGGGGGANVLISFPSNLLTSNTFEAVIGLGGIGQMTGDGTAGDQTQLNLSGGSNIISAGGGAGGVIATPLLFPEGGDGGTVTNTLGVTIINGDDGGKGGQGSNQWQDVGIPIPSPYNGISSQFGLETASNPIMIPLIDISNNFNAQYAGCGGGGGGAASGTGDEHSGGGLSGGQNVTVGGHYKPYSYTAVGMSSGVGRGITAQVYGGGGGGNSGSDQTQNETGGNGKSGAVYFWFDFSIPPLRNGCEWNTELAAQTPVWNRDDGNCVDLNGATLNGLAMTRQDLSEKRKATIFQYKKNSAGFSKKQQYSRLARGIGRQKGQSYATQSDTYTNPNTHNLVLDNSAVLICPAGVAKNWAWTSQNDTPGPVRKITNEPTVPLTNYIVRRTYLAGNNKWPQLGPSFDPTSTSRSSRSSSSWGSPMVAIMYPSTGEYYQITFTNLLILYNNLSDEQKIALINNLEQVPNVETATVSSGSLQIAVIVSNKNYNNNVITEIRTALNTWTMDNNFSSGVSNSWTNSPILSTTPLYHNTLQIYYITGPFGDGSYIKGVIMYKNKLILTNNTNLNYPIYPPVIPSQDLLSITKIANIEDTANTENNYQISIQTYTKKNVLFSTTDQYTVTIFVPTVVINSPSNYADIFNNTFNLVYTTTNMGPNNNNKIVLYQNNDDGKDITNEPNPYQVKNLTNDGEYNFKLQIVNKILALNPPIYNSIDIEMKVPNVEITNDAIIYNNTFKLTYSTTNVDNNTNNTIMLSKDGNDIDYITAPYPFTYLESQSYNFTLQIVNNVLTPVPDIYNSKTIEMKVPIVEITNTVTTIYNNTFELTYNTTNVDNNNYNKIMLSKNGNDIEYITAPYTFIGLESQSYTFKLQVDNDVPPVPDIYNSKTIEMKVPNVEITNDAIIYNNTFKLTYSTTNVDNNNYNKIMLSKNGNDIEYITAPYTFIGLESQSYTFKLQVDNDVPPVPDIYNSKTIEIKVPIVEITNDATIYNNTFELTYNATNVDNNNYNKIMLSKDGNDIEYITAPYTFIGLESQSYTFKLQVDNDVPPVPDIYNSKTIEIKVPIVEITNDATIYNNTFELTYNATNVDNNNYNKIMLSKDGNDIEYITAPYTFIGLESQSYTFKLQVDNDVLPPVPDIDNSKTIEMKVPIVEITSPTNTTTIYNNTFELTYSTDNMGSNNTIELYKNDSKVQEITGPYTFTNLANGTYTFKLQIVNDDLTPNPAIVNEITDITIAIPTIVITSPSTGATINTTTFVIGYTITNLPSSLVYGKIYQTLSGESEIILGYFDVADGEGTVSILQYAKSPTTSGEYEYRLEILNEDGSGPATTDITKNQATVSVIIPKPTLVVNNNSRTTKLADSNGIEFTYYYFQYGSGRSFTLTNSPVILSIDILLVGGGGGGGWDGGYWGSGGGGAGAYLTGQITATLGVQYNITIGAGGYGANGVSSSIVDSGSGGTIAQALGGGRGADNNGTVNGGAGSNMDPGNPQTPTPRDPPFSGPLGSGGGGSGATTAPGFSYPYTYDEFTYSMNTGGYGYSGRGGGGGGGAGQVGGNAPAGWIGGNGGNGIQWDDNRWYGGGGAGQGVNDRSNENYGGNGGGGGQIAHDRAGNFWTGDATSNTGGGGAAGQYDNGGPGFRGGSGICVIRLPTSSFTT